ncbi:DNA replication licensing factor MCM7 [Caerostris darwini]|uniref:DNA replication licensing factor MCM7 n=1 Tax=Caerostris darwini TaxID=1538125 RepID=A0AAV4QY10_9ARAC|nr:DNA replication licensing factor MCM7 [Caerostris darwini]
MAFNSCSRNAETQEVGPKDILDVYIQHRLKMDAMNHTEGEYRDPKNQYPPELLRCFEIYFKNRSEKDHLSVREVKAEHIGKPITEHMGENAAHKSKQNRKNTLLNLLDIITKKLILCHSCCLLTVKVKPVDYRNLEEDCICRLRVQSFKEKKSKSKNLQVVKLYRIAKMNKTEDYELEDHELTQAQAEEILNRRKIENI